MVDGFRVQNVSWPLVHWLAVVLGVAGLLSSARGQSSYTGTGIKLGLVADEARHPKIAEVLPGSPADRAGVRAGQAVLSVDGRDSDALEFGELVRALGGEPGQRHRVVVGPPRSAVELPVERMTGRCVTGDCADGTGLFEDVYGDLYSGQFRGGRYEGFGRLERGTNYVYEGGFKDGEFHGQGTLREDGRVFAGRWEEGREADGPGHLTLPNGGSFEGEGSWVNGFRGRGAYLDPKRQLRAEGEFDGGSGLDGLRGQASVRSLQTGHVYRGRFERGEPAGRGEIEPESGARFAAEFRSLDELVTALGRTNLAAVVRKPAQRTLGIDADPEPMAAAGGASGGGEASKAKASPVSSPRSVACEACAGTGRQLRRCGWCSGHGWVERNVVTYGRRPGSYSTRSVYDNVGRLAGTASGYDETRYQIITPRRENCGFCSGKGAKATNDRCVVCGGAGRTTER